MATTPTSPTPTPGKPAGSSKVLSFLRSIGKAVAAAVLPLVTVSLTNGSFDWKGVLAAGLTAVAVYLVPNGPKS